MDTPASGIGRPSDWFWNLRPGREAAAYQGSAGASKVVGRIFTRHRALILVALHAGAFAAVYPLAYMLRFDGTVPEPDRLRLLETLPWVVLIKLVVFLGLRGHRGWWRYATFADAVALAEAATLATVAVVVTGFLFRSGLSTPRAVVVLDWAGTVLLLGSLRGSTRLFRERYYPMITPQKADNVLVVGTSEPSLVLVRMLQSQQDLGVRVVGLLASEGRMVGKTLGGVTVVGSTAGVAEAASRYRARTVLVPTPAVGPQDIRELVTACGAAGVKVQVVPGFDALLNGSVSLQPRDVDIHDLLCREPVTLDGAAVGRFLRDKVVLVTGAAGSIGSEVCRQILAHRPAKVVLLDHSENGLFYIERELRARAGGIELATYVASVTDATRLRTAFDRHRPAVVFHAAAHKHVPLMETNPGEAVKNNVLGTRTLVDEAVRGGAEAFVMISTDKAVNPSSVMGATKRLAEMYVQALAARSKTRLVTVRFGNVLGSNGSVVPIFKEQIRRGGPVTVTHPEMTRYFMTIPEATQLVLQAGSLGRGGEIFVLDMGEPVRVVDLARDLIRLSGLVEGRDLEIVYTGLRPGEKLYEELYDDGEQRLTTTHPKIFRAMHRACDHDRLQQQIGKLAQTVDRTADEVRSALQEVVPEYHPQGAGAPGNGLARNEGYPPQACESVYSTA